jgi:formylglycine-generating enzyme required for sulfatase activity
LRKWEAGDQVKEAELELRGRKAPAGQGWYVNSEGHTMVLVAGPPPSDSDPAKAAHSFAIASKEVSIEQFLSFRRDYYHLAPPGKEGDYPANVVNWFDAVAYCRWLSDREDIAEDQMCYPPLADIKSGMKLADDYFRRTGYRLATEQEWELACRAGTVTSRYYGEPDELLGFYASYEGNSKNRLQPSGVRKPSDLGLFDMLGNTMEWCHGIADAGPAQDGRDVAIIRDDVARVTRGGGIHHQADGVRCTQRDTFPAATRWHSIGFRIVRTLPPDAVPRKKTNP